MDLSRSLYALLFCFGLLHSAHAGILTITSYPNPTQTVGNTTYFMVSPLGGAATVDGAKAFFASSTFTIKDLDVKTIADDLADNGNLDSLMEFTVVVTDPPTVNSGERLALVVQPLSSLTAAADESELAFMATLNGITCAGNADCFISGANRVAVAVPELNPAVQVGFYLGQICSDYSSTTGSACAPTVADSKQAYLKVSVGSFPVDAFGTITVNSTALAAASTQIITINTQVKTPQLICNLPTSGAYFPGDAQILFNTSALTTDTLVDSAPVQDIWVAGTRAEAATNTTRPTINTLSNFTSNGLFSAAVYGNETRITGFQNSTPTQSYAYSISFGLRDATGLVSYADSATCGIDNVRTADIRGFLNGNQCFIASAAFGRRPAWGVDLLRHFRDEVLLASRLGRVAVELYYAYSPHAALWLWDRTAPRFVILLVLLPIQMLAFLVLHLGSLVAGLGLLGVGYGVWIAAARRRLRVLPVLGLIFFGFSSAAETPTPYLDQLKANLDREAERAKKPVDAAGYSARERQRLEKVEETELDESDAERSRSYTERLQKHLPPASEAGGYSSRQRAVLGPDPSEPGAIARLKAGKEDLEFKRPGDIHHAVALKLGVTRDYQVTAGTIAATASSFDRIYGKSWYPDFTMHYEYQPFHSEWAGSIGAFGQVGFASFKGFGQFGVDLGVGTTESRTQFRFWMVPVTAGLNYRFNLASLIRPYVMLGATAIGYIESRNDGRDSYRGYSKGFTAIGGVAILLDGLSQSGSWDSYDSLGFKHSYLTIEASRMETFDSAIDFSISGVTAGFTFEY